MSRSEKLYKDSPKVGRNKDGDVGISRSSEATGEDIGTEGSPLPGAGDGMPVAVEQMHDRHSTEMKDMHKRHEDEHKDMHKRHEKEIKKTMVGDNKKEDKE